MQMKITTLSHTHSSLLCPVAHKASTMSRQAVLSWADFMVLISHPMQAFLISFCIILLYVVLGHPLFLRPSGVHVRAIVACVVGSIHNACPKPFPSSTALSARKMIPNEVKIVSGLEMTYMSIMIFFFRLAGIKDFQGQKAGTVQERTSTTNARTSRY